VEASTAEGGEDDTTESATGSSDTDDDAEVQPAESRIKRQLTSQLGNANLGDGAIKVEKHQYDVKKIANQVDTGKNLYQTRLTEPLVAALGLVAFSSGWMFLILRDQVICDPDFTKCILIRKDIRNIGTHITSQTHLLPNLLFFL